MKDEGAIYEAAFRLSPVGMVVSRADGVVVAVNDAALRILGVTREQMLGATAVSLGFLSKEQCERNLAAVLERGVVEGLETRLATPTGEILIAMSIRMVADGAPADARFVVAFRDVTRSRDTDERFRAMLEAAPDGVVLVDGDGTIELSNRRFELLFGYGVGELVGEPIERLLPERYRAAHPGLRRAFAASPAIRSMGAGRELFGRRKDGSEFPAEVSLSPLASGGAPRVVAVVSDITVRKAQETRYALTDRLASVGTLAGGIAHEINNPLAVVSGNLDMIAEELGDMTSVSPSARLRSLLEMVDEAREGAERVRRIVRGLKLFVRGDVDHREIVDVHRALETALQLTQSEIRQRATVVRSFGPVPDVIADEGRLVQVFINLLVNATQAMATGAKANVIYVTTTTEGGRAVVAVRDTGAGIAPEIQSRIFEPFFTTRDVGQGVGLGLPISHGIVTSLGGELTFETGPSGSTFRVTLPGAGEHAPEPASRDAKTSSPGRGGRVLVVDDEVLVTTTLERMLRGAHDVVAVRGGADALAEIERRLPDVVVCDLMMPGISGIEVFERSTSAHPELAERFVFVTGAAFTSAAREFLDRVPNHRLEKPCDPRALRAIVADLVRLKGRPAAPR